MTIGKTGDSNIRDILNVNVSTADSRTFNRVSPHKSLIISLSEDAKDIAKTLQFAGSIHQRFESEVVLWLARPGYNNNKRLNAHQTAYAENNIDELDLLLPLTT